MSFGYCPELERLVEARTVTGKSGKRFDKLDARSTRNNLRLIRALMLELAPLSTMEIGLSFGASALTFAATHKEKGAGTHIAIDPFQKTVWDSTGLDVIARAGLSSNFEFIEEMSSVALPKLMEGGRRFHMIYIDGSHLVEDVFVDAYYSSRMLHEGGVLLFDDSADCHVAKVLRFLRRSVSGLEEMDLSRYRENKLTYKAARWLRKVQLTGFRRIGPIVRPWNARFADF